MAAGAGHGRKQGGAGHGQQSRQCDGRAGARAGRGEWGGTGRLAVVRGALYFVKSVFRV